MARRALPADVWRQVRKDEAGVQKEMVTSTAVAEAGKAPPAHAPAEAVGGQIKLPPVEDISPPHLPEEIALPHKTIGPNGSEVTPGTSEGTHKNCSCADVQKCACNAIKDENKDKAAPITDTVLEKSWCACGQCVGSSILKLIQKALPEDQNAADDDAPGVMLALWTPGEQAAKLAQPDGTKPEDMHVTLGYYGKVGKDVHPDSVETITKCVAMSASGLKPVKAHVGGVGRFNASHTTGGKDVLIAHVDSPGLHDTRDTLIEHVHKCAAVMGAAPMASEAGDPGAGGPPNASGNAGLAARDRLGPLPRRDHGYTPHITLAYIDEAAQMPIHKLARDEFTFTHLALCVGNKRHLFRLGEAKEPTTKFMPIVKADDSQRLAMGIVLEPETVDAQGDIISEDTIRESAHNFLAKYNQKTKLGLQHELMKPDGVELVESWLAPVDMEINNRPIKKGTWLMTMRILNDALWLAIKSGQIGGFSIGGVARVQRYASPSG